MACGSASSALWLGKVPFICGLDTLTSSRCDHSRINHLLECRPSNRTTTVARKASAILPFDSSIHTSLNTWPVFAACCYRIMNAMPVRIQGHQQIRSLVDLFLVNFPGTACKVVIRDAFRKKRNALITPGTRSVCVRHIQRICCCHVQTDDTCPRRPDLKTFTTKFDPETL